MSVIHLIGFGSQGTAWAECLKASGWEVRVYLAQTGGTSFERAQAMGYAPRPTERITTDLYSSIPDGTHLVAMLLPDHLIAPVYREYLAAVNAPVTLVLAHGYAVYAKELERLGEKHNLALLAPKAIGPKLLAAHQTARPETHGLVAAFHAPDDRRAQLTRLARALGFSDSNLVPATFEQEAVGDLISEQSLLCGGVFTLLEWTMENMAKAGVPDALIREECLTELELIAGLLRERGPSATFRAISPAAQAGTVAMRERLEKAGLQQEFAAQAEDVTTRRFVQHMNDPRWRGQAQALMERLETWQSRLKKEGNNS